MDSVFERFSATAGEFAARPFLHIPAGSYSDCAVDFSYREALEAVQSLKGVYGDAGYGLGHRVGLILENRAELFLHWLALNALGAGIVPISHEASAGEIAHAIQLSEPALLVAIPETQSAFAGVAGKAGIPLVTIGDGFRPPSARNPASEGAPGPDTECAMLFTSGSTGPPKGCILNNDYFTRFGEWYAVLGGLCDLVPGKERLITPLPLTHMNALACSAMGMIHTGGCIIQLDRFHPSTWWQSVAESKASIIHYLGVMPAILLGMEETPEKRGQEVHFGFGAGADPRHQAAFETRFGFPLVEGWAMTETGSGGCIMANFEPRHVGARCFGRPTAAVEARVVDDAGQDVAPGTPGELLVRAAGDDPRQGFFAGYHKDKAATDAIWHGGWLHTGDIVRKGDDGSYFFVERKKAIIRRSGENISASEVEGALLGLQGVRQAAVAPVADDIREEEVMACIVLEAGHARDEAGAVAIVEALRDQISYFKLPGYIAFVDDLPLTASQKLQRGALKPLCCGLLAGDDTFDLRHLKRRQSVKQVAKQAPLARRKKGWLVANESRSYEGVAVLAPVSCEYTRHSEKSAAWFLGRGLAELIRDAGIAKQDIDGMAVASFSLAPDNVVTLSEYLGMTCRWLEALPFGGNSGVVGLKRAARAIQAGDASMIACLAGDTHKKNSFGEFVANFTEFAADAVLPYGAGGPNAVFSLITQFYMDRFGTSREDFGGLCRAQRYNAGRTPHALLREPLTMEDYLGARHIAGPLHLYDCVMPCAGAEAFLVTSLERAQEIGRPFVILLAAEEIYNAAPEEPVQIHGGWAGFRDQLYGAAGVQPDDIDLVQTYDDYPVISFMQMEELGFCSPGKAGKFFAETETRFDGPGRKNGGLPHNTSGGQLSCGQAGAAGGFLGMVEAIRQLTGVAGERQVAGAATGLVSGYGMVNYDSGLACSVAILKAGEA